MYDLSKISERLKELFKDSKLEIKELSEKIGIDNSELYRWQENKNTPSLNNLIILANYFNCSIEYLIGRTDSEHQILIKHDLPPLKTHMRYMIEKSGKSIYRVGKETRIYNQTIATWLSGKKIPTIYSLIRLAENLGCTVDQLIGRED